MESASRKQPFPAGKSVPSEFIGGKKWKLSFND
jgi:hypothetical protein